MIAVPTTNPVTTTPLVNHDPQLPEAVLRLLSSCPALSSMTLGDFARTAQVAGSEPQTRRLHPVPTIGPDRHDIRALLSQRELQVVRLVSEGLSNKDISYRLGLSDKTVKNHISHILAKLNLTARTQVAVLAIRGGFA